MTRSVYVILVVADVISWMPYCRRVVAICQSFVPVATKQTRKRSKQINEIQWWWETSNKKVLFVLQVKFYETNTSLYLLHTQRFLITPLTHTDTHTHKNNLKLTAITTNKIFMPILNKGNILLSKNIESTKNIRTFKTFFKFILTTPCRKKKNVLKLLALEALQMNLPACCAAFG